MPYLEHLERHVISAMPAGDGGDQFGAVAAGGLILQPIISSPSWSA